MVHGYVECTNIAAGEILHDCDPASAPHHLRVYVLKRHTTTAVYAVLTRLADEASSLGCEPAQSPMRFQGRSLMAGRDPATVGDLPVRGSSAATAKE
jgi:hypothetical protein